MKNLTKLALEAGASKEEVMGTLKIVYFVSGVGSLYTAACALEDVF